MAVGLGFLLWVDSGLAGFRAAVRRAPWPLPPGTVVRSILRGLAMGVETGMLCGILLWGMVTTASDADRLLLHAVDVGRAQLAVYGSYAITVVVALGVCAMRHPGRQALVEVLVRGPLLRSRPAVLVVGWCMGLWWADWRTALVSLVGCALALAFDPFLQWPQPADRPPDRSVR